MAEATEVQPELLEDELAPLGAADRWLADARARVAAICGEHRPPEAIADEAAYRDAKKARASANGALKDINAERTSMLRALKDAIKAFEDDERAAVAPLEEVVAAYDGPLRDYEERWRADRMQALSEAYGDYAPDLMALVPLDRLEERFGRESGRVWLARGTGQRKVEGMLREAIDRVADGESRIDQLVAEEDRETVKAYYFSTLSMDEALARAGDLARQRERVRRLEEERTARAQPPKTTYTMDEYREEYERVTGVPAPMTQAQQVAAAMGAPDPGRVPPYVFCGYGNAEQADEFINWCDRAGVSRRVKLPTKGRQYKLTTR